MLVHVLWVLVIFEPEWLVSGYVGGGSILKRLPTLLMPLLVLAIAANFKRHAFSWAFALFVLQHFAALPFVENRGLAMAACKNLYPPFLLFVATVSLVNTPARCMTLIKMMLLGYLWYGLQGILTGTVFWHTRMANPDSYGPLMAMGAGYAYCMAAGFRPGSWRRISTFTALLGVAGVVVSFARGAFLTFGIVSGVIWLRSPRKMVTLAAGIGALLIGLAVIQIRYPGGEFWQEMATITEGVEEGTGQDRWFLWGFGLEVFSHYPIFGVGAHNFGANAVKLLEYDPSRELYQETDTLYSKSLHSNYIQLLAEEGLVGFTLHIIMIVQFFQRTRRMRRPSYGRVWNRSVSPRCELKSVAMGLDVTMIGYLATSAIYPQIYIHWFYTLFTFAFAITYSCRPPARRGASQPKR